MKIIALLLSVSFSFKGLSLSLKDYPHYKFETRFTNPRCSEYEYSNMVESQSGESLYAKTLNAYCTPRDKSRNKKRRDTPYQKIQEWIKSFETKELFLAFLSFSESSISRSLCKNIKERDLKVTLIIDSNNLKDGRNKTIKQLQRCVGKSSRLKVKYLGGQAGLGYAHNKIIIVNPNSESKIKIAFASANLSSGVLTHHENWNFVTTHVDSFFAQVHLCVQEGMKNYSQSKNQFAAFFKNCKKSIQAAEENDIKTFFVPGQGEGSRALRTLLSSMGKANSINMTAHRFSYGKIINQLKQHLNKKRPLKMVVDDDLYYTQVYQKGMGRNSRGEAYKVADLSRKGAQVRYVETWMDVEENPRTGRPDIFTPAGGQLQHNKIALMEYSRNRGAVFTGAGNFTASAFTRNFENFYFITIPEVVKAYREQYDYLFNKLAKPYQEMPKKFSQP